ncbi:Origin recognition complex subunit 4 [Talaromyces islandicus]|uniref:Origin recognition complex subunit 4 n=1 Tax=Talaromyces islandicus TaxID=28573 RepID=A0A0U1LTV9_TALIS|nr:Origin recognition complex subunit 4 [Talaromyces islandicus]
MVESRASKRRRVSETPETNEQTAEIPATPPDEHEDLMAMDIDDPEADEELATTPSKSSKPSRRRSTINSTAKQENAETPSRSVRASGRQRKAPQRYEEDALALASTRKPRRAAAETPSKTPRPSARGARSVRKGRNSPDDTNTTDNDDGSPAPKASVTRRRSTRITRKTYSEDSEPPAADAAKDTTDSPMVNGGMDDSYDPVTAQLQQDLIQDIDAHEEQLENQNTPLPEYAETFCITCDPHLREEVGILSNFVLEKLTGRRVVPLKGLDAEYQKVYQLVEQTVTAGEGNSMLLMGSRGSGKTAMVESIISILAKDHKDDFHVVRLNGFFHTDDRVALREIWRQLGRETHTEDEASKINSYADTMATLLALLSHPEELFDGSNMIGIPTAKSVVIVLEEFDLFATHPRQTLLYNLFDIAQARKAPLAVLGLTTKVDVTEALEKRVKSRFSHRYVFLPSARTFEAFSEACLSALNVADEEIQDSELWQLKHGPRSQLIDSWRIFLKGLWGDKEFEKHLRQIYNQTKSVKDFFSSALLPISNLHHSAYGVVDGQSTSLGVPIPQSFVSHSLVCPDPAPLPFAPSMTGSASSTSLPLSLLLAATRLTALHDPGLDMGNPQDVAPLALSFPAAYAEYVRLLTSAKATAAAQGAAVTGGRVWGRDVSREAWEKLVGWGVVVPLGSGNGTTDGKMFRVEVSFEEVTDMVGGGGALGRWWRG